MSVDIPRNWRLQKERYRLLGNECPSCKEKMFPPKAICPSCGNNVKKSSGLSTEVTIYEAPPDFTEQLIKTETV